MSKSRKERKGLREREKKRERERKLQDLPKTFSDMQRNGIVLTIVFLSIETRASLFVTFKRSRGIFSPGTIIVVTVEGIAEKIDGEGLRGLAEDR